jgi:hypothetical protein
MHPEQNHKLEPKVYSTMVDDMAASQAFFWYVRSLDKEGTGQLKVHLPTVAKYFKKSKSTVRRWVNDAYSEGYITYVKRFRRENSVVIRYASFSRVADALGLSELGNVVWMDRKQMQSIKKTATAALMMMRQNQSFYKAREVNKKNKGTDRAKRVRGTQSLFKNKKINSRSNVRFSTKKRRKRGDKGVLFRNDRWCVVSEKFLLFGSTQLSLSKLMGRSVRTIRNRLKGIERVQLAKNVFRASENLNIAIDEFSKYAIDGKPLFKIDRYVVEPFCNVYNFSSSIHTSSSYRALNRYIRFKKRSASLG